MTQGRGRRDREHRAPVAAKQIFLYPLHRHWRPRLCAGDSELVRRENEPAGNRRQSACSKWRGVFSQERTFERARRLTFGLLSCLRMHLTSTAICASGRQFQDWSADYRVCSRSPWEPRQLFDVVLDHLPGLLPSAQAPVLVAIDDTILKKTSRRIPG
jgi:hypothetical protein